MASNQLLFMLVNFTLYPMKITTRDIDGFLRQPPAAARVVLIYGPDHGLMKERATILGKTVLDDLNDPFNAVTLSVDQIADDPARLSDEANAISMMGGARLIRITDGKDKLTTTIKAYLENPSDHALVVIEGGDLPARSSLRKAMESAKNAAALPCYVEDERDLGRFIRGACQEANLQIDQDALAWLASNIVGDRARARSEIEKLILYKGAPQDEGEPRLISLEDVQAICGAAGAANMDDLIHAIGLGQADKALHYLHKLTDEGVNFIAILRSLQNHFKRLHQARAAMDAGMPPDGAMKKLSPPVFFKYQAPFRAQLQRWRFTTLEKALERLMHLEADCKKTGAPVDSLCAQTILGLSKIRH